MKFKFVEVQGIPIKIIKLDDKKWYYKHHVCDCEDKYGNNCGQRIPYRELDKQNGIPLYIQEHLNNKINNTFFRKPMTKKHKENLSKSQKNRFKDANEREKMRKSMIGKMAREKHPNWKGGRHATRSRRRKLGFEPLNKQFRNSHAHHLDNNFVIYIPKEIHETYRHRPSNVESMKIINSLAFEFYTEQWFEENNITLKDFP